MRIDHNNQSKKLYRTQSTRLLYKDDFIKVEANKVIWPDGRLRLYSVVRFKGGVGVVAIDSNARICLVGQYRYAPGIYSWEIPKGAFKSFECGEKPITRAKKELLQETGFVASKWTELGYVYTLMGSTDDKVHLFHATGLSPGKAKPDLTEKDILIKMVSLKEFFTMQENQEITDGTSLAAVFLALRRGFISKGLK